MGLLEPWHIIILLFFIVPFAIIFPIWGYRAGSKRTIGAAGGLLLGLFFNFIGIIIVYCTNPVEQNPFRNFPAQSVADELQKYKQLFDSGAITEAEYNAQKAKILNS
jgi:hypothetical protein